MVATPCALFINYRITGLLTMLLRSQRRTQVSKSTAVTGVVKRIEIFPASLAAALWDVLKLHPGNRIPRQISSFEPDWWMGDGYCYFSSRGTPRSATWKKFAFSRGRHVCVGERVEGKRRDWLLENVSFSGEWKAISRNIWIMACFPWAKWFTVVQYRNNNARNGLQRLQFLVSCASWYAR